ncbi:hypothetical protein E2C01_024826 [Portunus trituberculatus]|uniref:Uncharacterized protein n=1 Tax=Portunus trituberculatus TaxID=210409 RepID=A0A5B7EEW6_PORTR|nr:hypothetical protein [Portunus trituberculatus]
MSEAFLCLKRRVVTNEPHPQLLGLIEGAIPISDYLLGQGHFHLGLYTPEPNLCGHCCQFRHQSRKCKSVPLCRPIREPQTRSTNVGPSRMVFWPAPPPQHNAWTNAAPTSLLYFYLLLMLLRAVHIKLPQRIH